MKKYISCLSILLCIAFIFMGCSSLSYGTTASMPEENGQAYAVINNNQPNFTPNDLGTKSFEDYSPLDTLGRCGPANACIGPDIMPIEERGSIGQVRPSGWHTVKYDHVDGKYLYNRCHLIGYQLTGENANESNLITGTRYLNTEGMLPFENMIADYVKETGNHVRYRVTPNFSGNNLVANGVTLEAKSVEDDGKGICFHVYCYNIQPGVTIDYTTGESRLAQQSNNSSTTGTVEEYNNSNEVGSYILNRSSKKFHLDSCYAVKDIKAENREEFTGDRQVVIDAGYSPCKNCNP